MLAVDSGAVQGAWIDCKHKNITNEALLSARYKRFFMKSLVISYSGGLRGNYTRVVSHLVNAPSLMEQKFTRPVIGQ